MLTPTNYRDLLEKIVLALVTKSKAASVESIQVDNVWTINVRVDPSDFGSVIGRHGRTIHAIRAILNLASLRDGTKVSIHVSQNMLCTLEDDVAAKAEAHGAPAGPSSGPANDPDQSDGPE